MEAPATHCSYDASAVLVRDVAGASVGPAGFHTISCSLKYNQIALVSLMAVVTGPCQHLTQDCTIAIMERVPVNISVITSCQMGQNANSTTRMRWC